MSRRPAFTDSALRRAHETSETIDEMARKLGVSITTVRRRCHRLRLKPPPRADHDDRRKFTDEELIEAHASCPTLRDVAIQLGVSTRTVSIHAQRLGLSKALRDDADREKRHAKWLETYIGHITVADIAEVHDVSTAAVRRGLWTAFRPFWDADTTDVSVMFRYPHTMYELKLANEMMRSPDLYREDLEPQGTATTLEEKLHANTLVPKPTIHGYLMSGPDR